MKSKYFLAFFLISIMLFSNLSLVFSSPNPYTTQTPYNKTGVVYDDSLLAFFKIGGYFFGDNPMNLYNCAVNVVHCMIGGNKFNLSLQLLSNDIENGEFDKGSIIKDGQIFTSLFSINKVLQSNGKNVSSFYMDVDVFTRNLKVDEDAILWVNDDHYIYVAKNSKGQFEVSDNNIAKGNMQNYSYSQFNKLLKGERISSDFYLNLNDSSSGPFSNKLTSNNVSKSINNFTYNNNKNPFIVVTTDSKNIKKIYKKTYTHTPNKKDKNTKKRVAKDKKSKEKYLLSDKDITKNKKTNKENKSINSHNTDVATEKNKPSPKQDISTDKNSNKDITTVKKATGSGKNNGKAKTYTEYELQNLLNGADAASTNGSKTTGYTDVLENGTMKVITDGEKIKKESSEISNEEAKTIKGAAYVTGQVQTAYIYDTATSLRNVAVKEGNQWYIYTYEVQCKNVGETTVSGTVWQSEGDIERDICEKEAANAKFNAEKASLHLSAAMYSEQAEKTALANAKAGKGVIMKAKISASEATSINSNINSAIAASENASASARTNLNNALSNYTDSVNNLASYAPDSQTNPNSPNNPTAVNNVENAANKVIEQFNNPNGGVVVDPGLSQYEKDKKATLLQKGGAIYKNNKVVGLWDGTNAYILDSSGKLVANTMLEKMITEKYSTSIRNANKSMIRTKIVALVNNVATGKVTNSAVYSLSKVITGKNKGTLIFSALATDITNGNFAESKFTGKNAYISMYGLKTTLNSYASKNYIARKTVKVAELKNAVKKGKTILKVKVSNKWRFIAISKATGNKITIYDNKKSKKIATKDMDSYLKKTYKFTSGIAITYNTKIGKTATTSDLKKAVAI